MAARNPNGEAGNPFRAWLWLALATCWLMQPCLAGWAPRTVGMTYAYGFVADSSGQRMFLGLAGAGLWKTEDGGANWQPLDDHLLPGGRNFPIGPFVGLDADADTVIITAAFSSPDHFSFCWLTEDGGETWQNLPNELVNGNQGDLLLFWPNDHRVLLHAGTMCFDRSDDFGQSWVSIDRDLLSAPVYSLRLSPADDSTLFVCTIFSASPSNHQPRGGVQRSTDLGQTWRPLINLDSLFGVSEGDAYDIAQLSNGRLIASCDSSPLRWENGNLLLSDDNGESWRRVFGYLPDRFLPNRIVEDAHEPGTVFVAGYQRYGLYWSHDYGDSWDRCLNGLPENVCIVNSLSQNPYSGKLYVTVTGYGIFESADHGWTWAPINGPPVGMIGELGVCGERVFVRDDGYRQWMVDAASGGYTEVSVPVASDTIVQMRPVFYDSGDTLIAALWKRPRANPQDLLQMTYSYDGGLSWQNEAPLPFLFQWYFRFHQWPTGSRVVTYQGNEFAASRDLGHTWTLRNFPTGFLPAGDVAQTDSSVFILVGNPSTQQVTVLETRDDGGSWTDLEYPGPERPIFIVLHNGLVTVLDERGCRCWTADGWQERGAVERMDEIGMVISAPTAEPLLFGLSQFRNEAWLSRDGGWTWEIAAVDPPFPSQCYGFTALKYNEVRDEIWAVSGVGLCYLDPADLAAGERPRFRAVDHELLSAYPNPFNASTTVKLRLAETGQCRIDVFDLTGRLVRRIHDGVVEAGTREFQFAASVLPSGVYVLRASTPRNELKQKLVLLR